MSIQPHCWHPAPCVAAQMLKAAVSQERGAEESFNSDSQAQRSESNECEQRCTGATAERSANSAGRAIFFFLINTKVCISTDQLKFCKGKIELCLTD